MSKIVTGRKGRLFVAGVLTAGMLVGCGNMTPTPPPVQCTAVQYVDANVCKNKAAQSITDFSLPVLSVGEKVTLTAKASSGLAVAYNSKTPTVCSVSGTQLTAVKAGECSVAANQAGDAKTLAAAETVVNATVSAPVTSSSKLTKTGITTCGNATENNLPCTKLALGDLHGLGQDGEVQEGQAMSYTVLNRRGAECVQDNVTGLIWEQKTADGGLRDKDWVYTWYNPNSATNGGFTGTRNGGACYDKAGGAQCDTQGYIQTLNAANYCGYSDWRMPSRTELLSIVDYGRLKPSINPVFINTPSSWYWSASPNANYSSLTWRVYFGYGYSNSFNKENSLRLRAVRMDIYLD